jgi:ABC-type dipeptide/oligopeptide/nickel transport system permease component
LAQWVFINNPAFPTAAEVVKDINADKDMLDILNMDYIICTRAKGLKKINNN